MWGDGKLRELSLETSNAGTSLIIIISENISELLINSYEGILR